MRSLLRKELIASFTEEFGRKLPNFRKLKLPKSTSPVWAFRISDRITFFILLQTLSRDQFVVEMAWNDKEDFPWAKFGDTIRTELPVWRGRLKERPDSIETATWDLAPEMTAQAKAQEPDDTRYHPPTPVQDVVPRIAPLVKNSVTKIVEVALPIFKKVAEERGLHWPNDLASQ